MKPILNKMHEAIQDSETAELHKLGLYPLQLLLLLGNGNKLRFIYVYQNNDDRGTLERRRKKSFYWYKGD